MRTILRANACFGKVIETKDHANHIVIERPTRPNLLRPEFHWLAETFDGRWQVGFELADPVRLTSFPDGGQAHPGPVAFLADVVAHLESVYQGRRVWRYMNPEHPSNHVEIREQPPAKLRDLGDPRAWGGRSRSAAKIEAGRRNLSNVNSARMHDGFERAKRYAALRRGGLTLSEIAQREGCTVNAVRCALKRARRSARAEEAASAEMQAEWAARLAQRQSLSAEQRRMMSFYEGNPVTHLPDGSIRIDLSDDSCCVVAAEAAG